MTHQQGARMNTKSKSRLRTDYRRLRVRPVFYTYKTCSQCGLYLQLKKFQPCDSAIDGYDHRCRKCVRKRLSDV